MSEEDGQRSFDPTPRRREQFRDDGRFAKSKDAGAVIASLAVIGALLGSREAIGRAVRVLFAQSHGDLSALARGDSTEVTQATIGVLLVLAVPAICAAALGGTVAGFLQAGFHVNLEALSFNPAKLNPFPNLKQLFSLKKGGIQVVLSLLRVGLVGYVAYRALLLELPKLLVLARLSVDVGAEQVIASASRVLLSALAALAGVAGIDYAQSRFTLGRELKMTRKEMMEESRSSDGDPKLKARMRARARALMRKRSIANVKTATVIVANPTHISVALRYTAEDFAPVLVAKGHDDLAMQIRAEARKHGIPILENRPLARALDAEVNIGQPIPGAHFAAVARILAFVYRIRGGNVARDVRKRVR
jgi:flagellar biosynthetic protein FlhB